MSWHLHTARSELGAALGLFDVPGSFFINLVSKRPAAFFVARPRLVQRGQRQSRACPLSGQGRIFPEQIIISSLRWLCLKFDFASSLSLATTRASRTFCSVVLTG